MWKVNPPAKGNIDSQLDAALIESDGTAKYTLSAAERSALHVLYDDYDALMGEPDARLNPAALSLCQDAIHDAYNQVQKGGRLATMRARLLRAARECPLCGAAPATTLDHHLPKGDYRSLAINPSNLIPCCQPCNRAKGTLDPAMGEALIHAYFQDIPAATFLVATSEYDAGTLVISFSVDSEIVEEPLLSKLTFQIRRLKLDERLADSINIFLFDLKTGIENFRKLPEAREEIRIFLQKAAVSLDGSFGKHHWKSAVARSLAACEPFLNNPWLYLDNPLASDATEEEAPDL